MNIRQAIVPSSKYAIKCPNAMSPIGICVHNTANDAAASGEISYMTSNASQTSFHIAVDDIEAVQGIAFTRNAWHAGDGANGEGNRKYIGIEICYSKSGGPKFDKAETNAIELIAQLLKERGWGIAQLKKHQDFSGKYCPHRTLDLGWDRFVNRVKLQLGGSDMASNMYRGLDLNDNASMKIAVDKLMDEREGKLIKKEVAEKATTDALSTQQESFNKKLKEELESQQKSFDQQLKDGKNQSYDQGFKAGKATVPTAPTSPVESDWVENGKSVTIVEGNKTTTLNYAKK